MFSFKLSYQQVKSLRTRQDVVGRSNDYNGAFPVSGDEERSREGRKGREGIVRKGKEGKSAGKGEGRKQGKREDSSPWSS